MRSQKTHALVFQVTYQRWAQFQAAFATVTFLLLATGFAGRASAAESCPNQVFRTGPSAKLPECRAYELVTPIYTGGMPPTYEGFLRDLPGMFATDTVAPAGDSVVYHTVGGGLSGFPATGYVDRYRARRTAAGWVTEPISPGGEEMTLGGPGGVSPDHEYSVNSAREPTAKLWPDPNVNMFLRTPDGYEPLARGSLGDAGNEAEAWSDWITAGATHVIFTARAKLEPEAPGPNVETVYDRTPDGPTHVVSLLPGDVTPTGPNAASHYLGATTDGTEVAFEIGGSFGSGSIYVRRDNSATEEVPLPGKGFTFDGIFSGKVFYSDVQSPFSSHYYTDFGDIYMYDLDDEETTQIASTGDASIVNVSEDGSHVYFVSKSPIDGEGTSGQPNLGVWMPATGSARFIATVAGADVTNNGETQTAGLNTWALAIAPGTSFDKGRASSHTRSTPDGGVFAFESTAQLTGFDNTEASAADCGDPQVAGEPCDEVYRYDAVSEELTCVSCGPGSGPATGNGRLQTVGFYGIREVEPATPNAVVESLTPDGNTVFFESTEGLLPADGNGTKDVYQWKKNSGLALISTGQGLGESALYGVTPDGSDVVFATRQQLLPQDENGSTLRLYDARVDGGFPPPEETVTEPCTGDACQGLPSGEPEATNIASSSLNGEGNVVPRLECGRRSRRVVRGGEERCVRRHRHKHHHRHHRAHHKRKGAR